MDEPARPKFQTLEVDESGNQTPVSNVPQTPKPVSVPETASRQRYSVEEVSSDNNAEVLQEKPTEASQPPGEPTTTTPSESDSKETAGKPPWGKYLFIVPAILLVATIGIVGAIASSKINGKANSEVSPTPAPTLIPATPIPTPKPVLRLKNYTNTALAIKLSYPENLSLLECDGSLQFVNASNSFNPTDFCDVGAKGIISLESQKDQYEYDGTEGVMETVQKVGGEDAIRQTAKETSQNLQFADRVTFSYNGNYYQVILYSKDFESQFNSLLDSIEFVKENPTLSWPTYTNTTYGYSIKYPDTWSINAGDTPTISKQVMVQKDSGNRSTQAVTIEADKDVSDAEINAQDVVSSTKSLSGWASTPSVDVRNLGNGTAQIIQGQLNGNWQAYIVVWYRNRVVQMTWVDNVDRGDQETFDYILSTFKFN